MLTETLAGLIVSVFLIVSTVIIYSRVNSVLHEGMQGYKTRVKLYEFIECYIREVHSSIDVSITPSGDGVDITLSGFGDNISYSVEMDNDEKFIVHNETKLFPVVDAYFIQFERMMLTELWLSAAGEFSLYGFRRIDNE